ncbi:MAG TPA: hypothetical protein VIL36_09025, partial [Acidimicrobiales bacterium]
MPASLAPVVERLFDDAGLFPPAAHTMGDALVRHHRARTGPHARLVGPFLCPVARLDELEACVAGGAPRPPELGVIAGPGEAPGRRRAMLRPGVVQLEAPLDLPVPDDAARLVRYVELPPRGDADAQVEEIAKAGARVKVRCGGLTPDAVPPARRLAEVVAACARLRVPFKATAGLHHAFRAPGRHGFLNLLAAASAALIGEGVEGLTELLETGADKAEQVRVRIDRSSRSLVAAIGTCSIDE